VGCDNMTCIVIVFKKDNWETKYKDKENNK
jgi:serine/threonine protein phosphatase PrpC